ncbi:Scr1 family TA system antitoxin-like transcriptional regulator [Actinomadura sp. LOL_016]|uniref:helix-turn-helix domain-containing protein n=1 Tax=unclassified Actinomadura TaxID=2626254 RepID=UPI003A812EA5
MSAPIPSESVRAFFAFHLKQIREGKGWSQPELGTRVHISGTLVAGIEACSRRPTRKLSRTLDEAFGLEQFFEALHPRIVEEAGLPPGFAEFTEAEAEAGVIKIYDNFVIADLFQTEEYARAVLRAGRPPNKVERLVAARAERQEILRQDSPPMVVALLDSSTLRRPFGGREVMRAQLEHLLTLAELPHVQVHMVPEDAALSPGGAFTLLSSASEPDRAYAESAGACGRLVDDAACVTELDQLLDVIKSKALNVEDSQVAVLKALEEL